MADSTSRQEIELLQGFISDTLNANSDASLESGIDAEVSATATSSDGDSTAKSLLQTAEGLKTANLDIDGNATVGVQNLLQVIADATGVSGDADSETSIGRTTGLKADNISVLKALGVLLGNVSTQIQSESDTTDGDSSSSTNLAESIGVDVADIDAQGELDLSSAANTTLNAKAEVTNSTADTETVEGAKASNTFTTARGTRPQISTQAMIQTSVQVLASAQMLRPMLPLDTQKRLTMPAISRH